MNTFRQKLNNLPKEVSQCLTSMKAAELNVLICERNNIREVDISKHTDIISQLFFKEIKLADLVKVVKDVFKIDDRQAKKLAIDIAGIRLLIIKDWLKEDVAGYIKSLGGNVQEYEKYIAEQQKAVIKEETEFQKELAEENKEYIAPLPKRDETLPQFQSISGKTKTNRIQEIFNGSLSEILKINDYNFESFLLEANLDMINLLAGEKGETFQSNLKNILLSNQEKLTFKEFYLEGKPTRPTVGHWLQDFIKQFGAAMPDNLQITRYLTGAKNIKILSAREKDVVNKLLHLYRNLVFFPNSMPKNIDDWEIFSVQKSNFSKVENYKTNIHGEKNSSVGKQDLALQTKPVATIIKPLKQTENASILTQLENMARQHPQESLERRAIEEEIAKEKRKR